MVHHAHRRLFGLLLGLVTGLVYGLVSQNINAIAMPGIRFYQPPFGPAGNVVMSSLLGAALGIACAWPENGFQGVFWSSLLGSLTIVIATLLTGRTDAEVWARKLTAVVFIFFPTAATLSPLLILFRWINTREEMAYLEQVHRGDRGSWLRPAMPFGLVLVAALVGLFSLYPALGRSVTPRMDALIKEGRKAQTTEALPAPLRPPDVKLFLEKAGAAYTLQWDKDDTNRFAIPRPATSPFDQSTVIARFDNGWWLVCMFPRPEAAPECRDF